MVEPTATSPLRFIGRVLSFRFTAADIAAVDRRHLALGLLFTWLVGIGRYWDNPRANTLQHLGLGSIAYVFVLTTFLWLLLMPLRPASWSYRHILTFISAVSVPGFLYAIPVERFLSLASAQTVNFWFLAVVATWRVALYGAFLSRYAQLQNLRLFVALFLPLSVIVLGLTALNLERAVFEIMAGNDPNQGTPADAAYGILVLLSFFSMFLTPVVLVLYLFAIYLVRRTAKQQPAELP